MAKHHLTTTTSVYFNAHLVTFSVYLGQFEHNVLSPSVFVPASATLTNDVLAFEAHEVDLPHLKVDDKAYFERMDTSSTSSIRKSCQCICESEAVNKFGDL